jgi:Transposase and inactivated derivatives
MENTRKNYPSDLTDEQWEMIADDIPPSPGGGRKRTTNMREIVNALLYLSKTGCQWAYLPHDYPPEGTVRMYFRKWQDAGILEKIHDKLRRKARVAENHEQEPSALIVDSQSVKTTRTAKERGFDAGKKINGIKRHIATDVFGFIICVVVTAASVQDRDGAKLLLNEIAKTQPQRLQIIWADGGYQGKLVDFVKTTYDWNLEIVKRNADVKGFKILPRRWVVERTFSWLENYRRLSKNFESSTKTSRQMVLISGAHIMLKRLTKPPKPNEKNNVLIRSLLI